MKNYKINIETLSYLAIFLLALKAALYPSRLIQYPEFIDSILELVSYSIWIVLIFSSKFNKNNLLFFILLEYLV